MPPDINNTTTNGKSTRDDGWTQVNRRKYPFPHNQRQRDLMQGSRQVKSNPNLQELDRIAVSFFVTNFPDSITMKDMWKRCLDWGNVVDVFIASRKAKTGKRFGFVRFVKVVNEERLIENLRSMWFGRCRMYADRVRFQRKESANIDSKRDPIGKSESTKDVSMNSVGNKSFADVLKGNNSNKDVLKGKNISENKGFEPVYVPVGKKVILNEGDLMDLERVKFSTLAKVNEVKVIQNLYQILISNGFKDFGIRYVGGHWVWINFDSENALASFKDSPEMKMLFAELCQPKKDFIPNERLAWIDVVGAPLVSWTTKAFQKIASTWGEPIFVDMDDNDPIAHGKICILTKHMHRIQEKVTVEVNNSSFVVSVLEQATWTPTFVMENSKNTSEASSEDEPDSYSTNETTSGETLDFQKEYDETTTKEDSHNGFDKTNNGVSEVHLDNPMNYELDGDEKRTVSDPFNDLRKEKIDVAIKEGADTVDQQEVTSKPLATEDLSTLTESCSSRPDYVGLSTKEVSNFENI